MRVLSLDLSSHAGWAVLEGKPGSKPRLIDHGLIELTKPAKDLAPYPWCYLKAAKSIAGQVMSVAHQYDELPTIVIEETNLGKQRYSQKLLEWIHLEVVQHLYSYLSHRADGSESLPEVVYISSRSWRKALGLQLSKDQRALNAKVSRAKQQAKVDGVVDVKQFNAAKKKLGVKGRINWKNLSVDLVNEPLDGRGFGLQFKKKDNDIADAICVGYAYFLGADHCDGVSENR